MKFVFVILALGELSTQALFRGKVTGKYFHKNFHAYKNNNVFFIINSSLSD